VLTSAAIDYDWKQALPGIDVQNVSAAETTTFENVYTAAGRRQTIHSRAERLFFQHIPSNWLHSPIIHLAPIADEIDPEMLHRFGKSLVGMTPQGWMRNWDEKGRISPRTWEGAASYFPFASAVILSEEDLPDQSVLDHYRQWAKLLVLTEGSRGCTLFYKDEIHHVPTEPLREADPTGAGDIFAAAFLIHLHQTGGDPWSAAQFANQIAGASVSRVGLSEKITRFKEIFVSKKLKSTLQSR
jgi:sugar/nucleoside kinase (ribokinase family)